MIWSKVRESSPEASATQVIACREVSLTQDVLHLQEKCRPDLGLFEKVYCSSARMFRFGKKDNGVWAEAVIAVNTRQLEQFFEHTQPV